MNTKITEGSYGSVLFVSFAGFVVDWGLFYRPRRTLGLAPICS